ncbi:hypothetical protein [Streptomyces sp. NPDC047028]|uniref:hypothetical protein n=1 Tax=Streptomyces sp. NPDC047028 TaxID=3155793 RepID=UPI0033D7F5DD
MGKTADDRRDRHRDVPDADFDDEQVRATMDGHKVPFESVIGDPYRDVNGRQSYAERLLPHPQAGRVPGLDRRPRSRHDVDRRLSASPPSSSAGSSSGGGGGSSSGGVGGGAGGGGGGSW